METAGKGINSLIFPPGFDARGFRDIQAKPVDEETSSDRRFCAGSHAQQRSHPRCWAADEVRSICGINSLKFFFFQRSNQEWLARERRCLCQMFSHFCPGLLDSVALAGENYLLVTSGAAQGFREGQIPLTRPWWHQLQGHLHGAHQGQGEDISSSHS